MVPVPYILSLPSISQTEYVGNYSGILIGRTIAILYFLATKITAEERESS